MGKSLAMEIYENETLNAIKLQLNGVIEFLPDPTFVIGVDGKVPRWNCAIEEMARVPKEDMIGKGATFSQRRRRCSIHRVCARAPSNPSAILPNEKRRKKH
ncbi:hypothetical protein SBDP2_1910009 [Syntrophobacter sp. SbD2]|nr:hypothetical protein SBDP2_1910009 [Syntrophobacter sp. SbD2]